MSRSRLRASIATAYPPREKRQAMAAPVPGPTPATTTTGFGMLISQTPCGCVGDLHLRGRRRTPPSRASLQHHPEPRLAAHHAVVSLRCSIQRILLDQWLHSGERAELQRILGIDGGPAGPARYDLPCENQWQYVRLQRLKGRTDDHEPPAISEPTNRRRHRVRVRHRRQRNLWSDQVVRVAAVIRDARSSKVLAGHVIAAPARLALEAVAPIPAQPDALPDFPLSYALANRIDQTNDLVPWHSRIRDREDAFLGHRIAMANPTGLHPHSHLASLRVRHFPRYQFDRSSLGDHLRISPRHSSFPF